MKEIFELLTSDNLAILSFQRNQMCALFTYSHTRIFSILTAELDIMHIMKIYMDWMPKSMFMIISMIRRIKLVCYLSTFLLF